MPVYRGTTPVLKEYVGTTPVLRRYRGSTLVADYAPPATPAAIGVRSVAVSTYAQTGHTGTTTKTAAVPAHEVGDLLLCFLGSDTGALATLTLPAGYAWTEIVRQGGNAQKFVVGWLRVTELLPSTVTFGTASDSDAVATMLAIKDAHPTVNPTEVDAAGTAIANNGTVTWSSVTPPAGSSTNLLIRGVYRLGGASSRTMSWAHSSAGSDAGTTELSDFTAGGWNNIATYSQPHNSTAATGTRTATLTVNETTTRVPRHVHIAIPQRP